MAIVLPSVSARPVPAETTARPQGMAWFQPAMIAIFTSFVAALGTAGPVTAARYNPQHLPDDQFAQINGICLQDMGLIKAEPVGPPWAPNGDPYPGRWENHYQGCIDSLSDTLRAVDGHAAALVAGEACDAQGLGADTAKRAQCILSAVASEQSSAKPTASAEPRPAANNVALRSIKPFFMVGPREARRREQEACASLGLDPAGGAFSSCVKHLAAIFYAIDNPKF